MRKLVVVVLILAIAIGAWLLLTVPRTSRGIRLPLSAQDRALLAQVPDSAEELALVPNAAALEAKLDANPVTRDALARAMQKQTLPLTWMLGGADVVVWRSNGRTSWLVQLDPVRAIIARTYLMLRGNGNNAVLINAPAGHPIDGAELDRILSIGAGLPPGDALTIQRTSSRGAFPPLPRPAVSSIAITANEVDITSRATPDPGTVIPPQPLHVRFPKSAILTASFATPPRAIELHRIFSKEITTLLGDGGTIAIYDIDTRKLLPKPRQVIAFPATPERRQALTGIINMIGKTGQEMTGLRTVDSGTELVVGFDETSMDHYLKDGSDEARWPANLWAAKIDPKRMVPLLNEIDGNPALRIVAPKLHRSIRDLKHWIGSLESAESIEAADTIDAHSEELRVVVKAK